MIRHFVLVKFAAQTSAETKASLYRELEGLRKHIDGILHFHAGPNVSIETDLVRGFNDAFWFDFADENVRAAYLADAGHQAVGAKIVQHTIGGAEGVIVVDMML